MDNKTMTDIILICKGHYDKSKHETKLDALSSYYNSCYRRGNIQVSLLPIEFIFKVYIKPTVLEAIKRDSSLAMYLFQPTVLESYKGNNRKLKSTTEVMYYRCITLIQMIKHSTFNLPLQDEDDPIIII